MNSQAEMFKNRLNKNLRRLRPWAQQQGISAYRLYDRDIPEVGLQVDFYQGHLHVAEYARRGPRQADEQEAWLDDVLGALCALCEVPKERIFLKLRQRQRGTAQYGRMGNEHHELIIHEGGHRFLVNLSDYLDTGLFLDHRDTRRLVQEMAPGRRVLNLFGYTGSFTVYAAAGGARTTTTVDLSNTYLDWAARNLALNGLSTGRNQLLRADVLDYLQTAERQTPFDLIVLDPPTFSNSKKMAGTLDIERDHPALLRQALLRLSPSGTLLFSSNCRGLRLRPEEVPGCSCQDITADTIPRDFHDPHVHRCWLFRPA